MMIFLGIVAAILSIGALALIALFWACDKAAAKLEQDRYDYDHNS
jgi:hypothetical protein